MKRILLIGDQPAGDKNIMEILGLANFDVLATQLPPKSGAIEFAAPPDLVICELADPQSDVQDTLRQLLKQTAPYQVPLIVLTGDAGKANTRRIMQLGADDFLVKPFEGIELLRAVDACLDKHQRRLHPLPDPSALAGSPTVDPSIPWRPANREPQEFKKKEMLYSEGQRAAHAWYIVDGKIKTYLLHSDGKELITSIKGPGECVGYTAVIGGGVHTDNAQSIEDATLIGIPCQEFLSLLRSDPAFAHQLVHWIAQNAGDKEAGLLNFAYSSLRKKVANGILRLAGEQDRKQKGKRYLTISRENLAAFVGSAPESLTRTLGDFRKEGLIGIADGRIWLLNEEKLRNLLN